MTTARHHPHRDDGAEAARERLLDTAEDLFAEHGFSATSVRHITAEADCNVAAVNYYFGGKAALYAEVFRRRLAALREYRLGRIRRLMESDDEVTLERLLRTITDAFLEPLVAHSRGRLTMRLLVHEILDPHLPPGNLADQMMGPFQEAVVAALRRVCPGLDRAAALRCAHSLIAQLVHTIHTARIFDQRPETAEALELETMVEHIVCFSRAGIQGCAGGEGE